MERENTKKLVILSEIDELKVIANNHYLMGKFNEAIKITEKIIEIAETAKLYSLVREHTNFIAEIYKKIKAEDKFSLIRDKFENLKIKYEELIQKKTLDDAHQLVNKFREESNKFIDLNELDALKRFIEADEKRWKEYSKIETNLRKKLEPLEIQLNSYLTTNNIELARGILEKAKPILNELQDKDLLKMWETVEAMFLELQSQEEMDTKVQNVIKEVSKLTENYQFNTAKQKLENLLEQVKLKNLSKHIAPIEQELKNILDAEFKYRDLEKELLELEKKVTENVANNLFKVAIDNINQIIKISRFIGKNQNLEKYSKYIDEIEQKIKRIRLEQEIRDIVKVINVKAIQALKKGDFSSALEKFEVIISKLTSIK